MPNGGHNCGGCSNFDRTWWWCDLHETEIDRPRWTRCEEAHLEASEEPEGPVEAILQVYTADRKMGYYRLPYLNGRRPWSERGEDGASEIFVTGEGGETLRFSSPKAYMEYYEKHAD